MTYDQIQVFLTIVHAGSFKAASQQLHKTQPSLSVAVKKLEEELGLALFDRRPYRPTLTPEGRAFYERAMKTYKSFQELEYFGKELGQGIEGEVRLALDAACPLDRLGPFLHQFFESRSTKLNLSVEVLEGSLSKLQNREVDLAITPVLQEDRSVEFIELLDLVMIPVISKALLAKPTYEKLLELPQIVVRNTGAPSPTTYGVEEGKKWYVTDHYLKSYLIHNSLGWGRLPSHLVEEGLKSKQLLELTKYGVRRLSFKLALMKRRHEPLGTVTQELWERLPVVMN